MSNIIEILKKIETNTKNGSKTFYHPLSKEDSKPIREAYKSWMRIPVDGNPAMKFYNSSGTLVAEGYVRVVIGDYGPYIEFDKDQIRLANIKNRWPGKPLRPVKYIWMQTIDASKTKVYAQQGTVSYADYKPGMFYVDPIDLHTDELDILVERSTND